MQTRIHPEIIELPLVKEADSILRRCVHCGFCTATCPTYQLLGDELDGPRGRIYLIKNLLENNSIEDRSVTHLDRCLTCRACETTCPSGVQYGRLLDIARELLVKKSKRPVAFRLKSFLARLIIPRDLLFRPLLRCGQFLRPALPAAIAHKVPPKLQPLAVVENNIERSAGKVLLLQGCAQRAATPNVNTALEQLLATQNIAVSRLADEGCCGAVDYHLLAHERGLRRMRALVDRLYERLAEVDYIVSSASGCGVTIKEYPSYLVDDPVYAGRARAVVEKVVDAVELLCKFEFSCEAVEVAVHTPCTLQHGQGIAGEIERVLERAGAKIVTSRDSHLCCGSAGTYSIMQAEISRQLLARKLDALQQNSPQLIVTANIGCQLQLASKAGVAVMHWVEFLQKHSQN
jgi:glycolate oxidase iron-sulfur subunit